MMLVTRVLCWFAAFPPAAYAQLETPSHRVALLVRGFAVILSPLVFTLALQHNGARLIGSVPYLYFLPAAVFCLDWFLISRSYTAHDRPGVLLAVRLSVILVSAAMAIFSGLLMEGDNLVQRLHRAEDAATLLGGPAQQIKASKEAISKQLAGNDQVLATRAAIELELLDARRLHQLECNAEGGVDKKTGIKIIGGQCGRRAQAHRIDAENAEARLAQLDGLVAANQRLYQQQAELDRGEQALLESNRSPGNSLGTLVRALGEADVGVWLTVFLTAAIIVLMEAMALMFSEMAVGSVLRSAVEQSAAIDQLRLDAAYEAKRAEIAKERMARRTEAADGLAPLEVKLTAAKPAPLDARLGDGDGHEDPNA